MKILNTNQFIEEKMKIVPISNDELDNISDYYDFSTSIKQPDFNDLCIPGNVILTRYNTSTSKHALWLCVDRDTLERIGIDRDDVKFALIREINTKTTHRQSWNDVEGWRDRFPSHRMFGDNLKIETIYTKTNIDVSKLNGANFQNTYNDIFNQYIKTYPNIEFNA